MDYRPRQPLSLRVPNGRVCLNCIPWVLVVNGCVVDNFWYNRGAMDWKTLIAAYAFILTLLFILHQLIIKRRDATIEGQDREIARLKTLLDEAKNASPDVLAERKTKKIDRLEAELKELLKESELNQAAIKDKEDELEAEGTSVVVLLEEMAAANNLLEEYKSFKDEFSCPHCDAPLISLDDEYQAYYKLYECRRVSTTLRHLPFEFSVAPALKPVGRPAGWAG